MENEISVASLIISIIILIVVILIIIFICYSNNDNKQIKDNFVARPVIKCAHWYSAQYGTSQCCGAQDGRSCTTEVYGKNGHCSDGYCIL